MNKFRLMRKMIYPPSIFWLVVSCSAFAVCIFLLHFVWIKLIPLPPSPQLFDCIASIVSVFIFLIFIIGVICAIITFDFWCRPVFLTENEITRGFIFRRRIKKEDITGIGLAQVYSAETETIYNDHKYGVYVCAGQYDETLIRRIGIWEALFHSELIKGLSKCHLSLKRKGTDTSSNEQLYPDTIFYLGADLDLYAVIKAWMSET